MNHFIEKVKRDTSLQGAPEPEIVLKHDFTDFPIDPRLLQNIVKKGYKTPTPIQDQSIQHSLAGSDVIGLANTGTGKTAAFLIPLIDKMLKDKRQKAIILAPSRELAVQIRDELIAFTRGMDIHSVICIGGTNMSQQIRGLRTRYNFLIGTPGRVIDMAKRGFILLNVFQNAVLDEADRMVDMGFINDMKLVFSKLPKERQTLFFTATFGKEIEGLVQQFLKDPITISVKRRDTSANVRQDIIRVVDQSAKIRALLDLLNKPEFEKVLVFGRTKHGVEKIYKALRMEGIKVDSIHGNKSQNHRLQALQSFKTGNTKVLIATDIASRGLDIECISHVINFDLPATYDDYVHRIGRTGRASQKGVAVSLVTG